MRRYVRGGMGAVVYWVKGHCWAWLVFWILGQLCERVQEKDWCVKAGRVNVSCVNVSCVNFCRVAQACSTSCVVRFNVFFLFTCIFIVFLYFTRIKIDWKKKWDRVAFLILTTLRFGNMSLYASKMFECVYMTAQELLYMSKMSPCFAKMFQTSLCMVSG